MLVRLSSFSFFFVSLAGARDQNNEYQYVTKNVTRWRGEGGLHFRCLEISTAQRTKLRMQQKKLQLEIMYCAFHKFMMR